MLECESVLKEMSDEVLRSAQCQCYSVMFRAALVGSASREVNRVEPQTGDRFSALLANC